MNAWEDNCTAIDPYITLGTCSECGGRVVQMKEWSSTTVNIESPKYCLECRATPVKDHGPVIQMKKLSAECNVDKLPVLKSTYTICTPVPAQPIFIEAAPFDPNIPVMCPSVWIDPKDMADWPKPIFSYNG